jgi:hypothetical protein
MELGLPAHDFVAEELEALADENDPRLLRSRVGFARKTTAALSDPRVINYLHFPVPLLASIEQVARGFPDGTLDRKLQTDMLAGNQPSVMEVQSHELSR